MASRASQLSSEEGWATLGLSPSSDLHHTNAAPKPLEKHQQTRHIQSAPERRLPLVFTWEPPGIRGFLHSLLTRCQFDLKGRANQGHQCGGEVHCVVICNGHVHLHQALVGSKAKRTAHEPETSYQQLKEKRLRRDCVYASGIKMELTGRQICPVCIFQNPKTF